MGPGEAASALVFGGLGGCYAVARLWRLIADLIRGSL